MLIREEVLEAIARGEVSLQFRRWKRPTVKAGGTLRTKAGMLAIGAVTTIAIADVTLEEARRAGYADVAEALGWLEGRAGEVYRIEVSFAGADPRLALRSAALTDEDLAAAVGALDALDARAGAGAWTETAMELIGTRPGVLAETLAHDAGMERAPFKARIRKLKDLGLTESLKVGYRLSPRGRAVHRFRTGRDMTAEPADPRPPRRGTS